MLSRNELITLKDNDWLVKQRIAGKCVGTTLSLLRKMVIEGVNLSLKDLEAAALKQIQADNCIPTFQGYRGFPGVICLSVNKQLVHGIPSNYILQEGDVVKIDLGATYEGAIGDAALTVIYGKPKDKSHIELINVCKESLYKAIESISIGKQLGVIGNAIHKYVTSRSGFGIVTEYGGHGVGINPHESPFVCNKAKSNDGPRFQNGMSLCIEPMLTIGDPRTRIGSDGWTVSCEGISAHFEHTIFIINDKVEVLTEWS
jgi:methionyl aminopeptidase